MSVGGYSASTPEPGVSEVPGHGTLTASKPAASSSHAAEDASKAAPDSASKPEETVVAALARLREIKPEDGGPKQQELANAAKILRKLSQDMSNAKLYAMRRDVLERAIGEGLFFVFEAAGFEERQAESGAVLQWCGPEAKESLESTLQEVQKAADLALDPEALTFQQVSEMVAQNRTLPGIVEVDDKVTKPLEPKESQVSRPKKPWEKTVAAEEPAAA